MAVSQRLRLADVRRALHLVGECRELGRDPAQWRTHLAERVIGLVGAVTCISFELNYPATPFVPRILHDAGWDAAGRSIFLAYMADNGPATDPTHVGIQRQSRPSLTLTRQELIGDDEWYASPAVSEARRAADVDHCIHSQRLLLRHGLWDEFTVHRGWRDPPFGDRERRMLALFHTELARLWTRRPASAAMPVPVAELPARVRRVYGHLVRGDTERQAAIAIGIAPQTVHSYVKELYKRLNVSSRAELLLRYLPAYDFTPRLTTMAPARHAT